jgi:hypothetical protein
MFLLLKKFFIESISLINYISSFYLSNIIIITFLQVLFLYVIYNFYKLLVIELREANKNKLIKNNTNLIKNILLTYHQEQIIFITKIFNNQEIQELFFENIFKNDDKLFLSKITKNYSSKIDDESIKIEEMNSRLNESIDTTNAKYPDLPDSEEDTEIRTF